MAEKWGRSTNKMVYAEATLNDGDYVYQASEL